MQGHEVGQQQGTIEFFLIDAEFLGIFHDGQGNGHALIAAAGVDDYGQFAAVHAGIRTGSSSGAGADTDVLTVSLEQGFADIGAVIVFESFVGNGRVIGNLPVQDCLHIGDITSHGKIVDIFNGHAFVVGLAFLYGRYDFLFEQDFAVARDFGDIGMFVDYLNFGAVLAFADLDDDIENMVRLGKFHVYFRMREVITELCLIVFAGLSDNFEPCCFVTGDNADSGGSFDALAAAGVGDDNALDIFDDVAAGGDGDFIRQAAEDGAGFGGTVGNGDGLGATHRGHQLPLEDFDIAVIDGAVFFHYGISISYIVMFFIIMDFSLEK